MFGLACPYSRAQHKILTRHRLLDWIKRKVPELKLRDSLFIYYHLTEHTFVVAKWIVPCKLFIDLWNLGTHYEELTPEGIRDFLQRLRHPISKQEMREKMRLQEWRELSDKQDTNDACVEYRSRPLNRIMEVVP